MKTVKMIIAAVVALMGFAVATKVNAAQLQNAKVTLSDSRPSQSSEYKIDFKQTTAATIDKITFEICTKASGGCTATNTSYGSLTASATDMGVPGDWTLSHASELITAQNTGAQHSIGLTAGQGYTMTISGLTNTGSVNVCDTVANSETCYIRISELSYGTHSDDSGVVTTVDTGAITFTLIDYVTVTAKVDPTFSFTVTGIAANQVNNGITTLAGSEAQTLPFGNLQAGVVRYVAHQLKVATNTQGGYSVYAKMLVPMTGVYAQNNIDPFAAPWGTPTTWTAPSGTTANDNTGWFGGNTTDTDVAGWTSSTASKFGGIGDTNVMVMTKNGPDNGQDVDAVYVSYGIAANMYQPSDYYQGTLVYNAIPTY